MRKTLAFAAAMLIAPSALAGTSAWHETTGGKLRLVTQSRADTQGVLRGVLEIRLDEGWKTYWKEPGEAGVAPQISFGGDGGRVALHFPAPEWFDDGVSQWAGYEDYVRLPVEFSALDDPSSPLTLDVFIGVCETICVPVQERLTVRPGEGVGPIDEAEIGMAFAGLPAEPHDGFEATRARATDDILTIEVEIPDDDAPELFLAGRDGLMLAVPEFEPTESGGIFTARIVRRGKSDKINADYTLISGDAAVSGLVAPD